MHTIDLQLLAHSKYHCSAFAEKIIEVDISGIENDTIGELKNRLNSFAEVLDNTNLTSKMYITVVLKDADKSLKTKATQTHYAQMFANAFCNWMLYQPLVERDRERRMSVAIPMQIDQVLASRLINYCTKIDSFGLAIKYNNRLIMEV